MQTKLLLYPKYMAYETMLSRLRFILLCREQIDFDQYLDFMTIKLVGVNGNNNVYQMLFNIFIIRLERHLQKNSSYTICSTLIDSHFKRCMSAHPFR